MSICIEVVIIGQAGGVETYNSGDFVNVYPAEQMGEWNGVFYVRDIVGMPKTGLIFITNFPAIFNDPVEVARKLCRANGVFKREWGSSLIAMPTPFKTEFEASKFTTVTWGLLKAFTTNKVTTNFLTDGDLSG